MTVLAIDPGREKCGVALCTPGEADRAHILYREIVATERVVARVLQLRLEFPFTHVLLGDGTHSSVLGRALRETLPEGFSVTLVPEAFTSQRARVRLQGESLPRGLWRLVPKGMRTPPKPYDDYVAVILAEDWFARRASHNDSEASSQSERGVDQPGRE